jgi:hypothetical protein
VVSDPIRIARCRAIRERSIIDAIHDALMTGSTSKRCVKRIDPVQVDRPIQDGRRRFRHPFVDFRGSRNPAAVPIASPGAS